jgi:hypothetical protein
MRRSRLAVASTAIVLGLACEPPPMSGPPSAPTSAPSATPAPPPTGPAPALAEPAPTPFTAQQIRDASRPGRTWIWYVEVPGKPTVRRRVTITKVEPERAEMETAALDETGKEIEKTPAKSVTWEELRKHAEFPRDEVTMREEVIEAPAGVYSCVVYVVKSGDDETTTYYFAKDLPGAPVYFFTDKGGQRTMTSTLLDYRPGW